VSVPNSILSVLLVVVWLFVLVPMVVNRRPKVMTVSQAALNTRVLFRGGLDKLKHRARPGLAADLPEEDEDDEEGATIRRPVAEVFADAAEAATAHRRHHDDYEVADDAEFVEDDVPPRRQHEDEIVDDAELVAVRDRRRETSDDDEDAEAFEEAELQQLAHRLGRGGYNPNADASARAHRYAVRQRFVLGLLVSLIAAIVLAFAMTPLVWYAVAVIAATLVGYLAYLRRQVRIEEQIRARRMARFARSRGPEHIEDSAPRVSRPRAERRREQQREAAPDASAQRPVRKARGPRVVAIDEDDPDFVDLPSPHDGVLRRASGQ
jgi:hypothetical protein